MGDSSLVFSAMSNETDYTYPPQLDSPQTRVYSLQGDFEQARSYSPEQRRCCFKINGPNHSSMAELYAYLSDFYLRKKRFG